MSGFKRWLQSLLLVIGLGVLTPSCQLLFGDFKVGAGPQGGAGGTDGSVSGGGTNAQGGASGSGQPSGPIVVVPTSDLYTSDLGAQARFYVSLGHKPSAPVTIPISSANVAEGTVSPASLTFTTDDWNAPQAVTVTGVHDPQPGNQAYTVDVGPATSEDKTFKGAKSVVSLTNIDNDTAGFFVTPTSGLLTTEAGGPAFFTVVLNSPPMASVDIALTSNDVSIGKVAPSSLTFTVDNWSAPQTVTVTGVNDTIVGARPYQITVGPPMSADESYAKLPSQTVSVTNLDNDQAGVMVALATGIDPSDTTRLRTSENRDTASFTVVLNNAPINPVTIEVMSSTPSEGTVSPASLTFTSANWAAPQTVTVVGVDNDSIADGDQPYQVTLGITSDDPDYGQLTTADLPYVNVVNIDNDQAKVAVTLLSGLDPSDASELLTGESSKVSPATFSIALASKPSATVQFKLTSTDDTEGKVSPAAINFTVDNWYLAQVVTVTGVNDNEKDGNVVYAVHITNPMSEDSAYQKLPATDVKVVNVDDDAAGLTVTLVSGIDGGSKLNTTESGGTASFSVSLTSEPSSDVTVPIASSNTNEGKVTPATLTFTQANYANPQIVTVTGVNDPVPVVDGNQAYTVNVGPSKSTSDTNYVGLTQSIKVTNQDDDWPYIVVSPTNTNATIPENGGTATWGLSLHSQPSSGVTLALTSSDTNKGTVSPGSMTFTAANWSTPQNVTISSVNDNVATGDQSYTVSVKASSTDANYMYQATSLAITNHEDDVVGLKLNAAANLQTTEAGGQATFTVALTSQPTGSVNVAVTSSDTKEGSVSPASLAFTTTNWSTAQTVTVTGVDDSIADGSKTYTVSLKASSSADTKYGQLAARTVSLVNADDSDAVGISVTPTSCATTPTMTASFSVVLKSQPLGPVSIALSSDTPTEGKVAPATLSFTTSNWNTAIPVTVTGLDDGTMGMMTPYKIVTAAAVSAMDPAYNGLNAADVSCINTTPMPEMPPMPPSP